MVDVGNCWESWAGAGGRGPREDGQGQSYLMLLGPRKLAWNSYLGKVGRCTLATVQYKYKYQYHDQYQYQYKYEYGYLEVAC